MLGKSGTAGTPAYLKGNIDHVAVFDKALSDVEVLEMYTNYKVPADFVIPVELTTFTAQAVGGKINFIGKQQQKPITRGYDIQRSLDKNNFDTIGFVAGAGTSTETHSYSFVDDNSSSKEMYYRLKQINYDGTFWYSQIVQAAGLVPNEFALIAELP